MHTFFSKFQLLDTIFPCGIEIDVGTTIVLLLHQLHRLLNNDNNKKIIQNTSHKYINTNTIYTP